MISFRCLISLVIEKFIMQSPGYMLYSLNGLWIRINLLKREYFLYYSTSPQISTIRETIPRARSSPHRWILLAFRASSAFVHAHPLSELPIIWISSITATSYSSLRGAASIVQLMRLEFLNYFSWPVIKEQLPSFCWYSQARSLRGAI